MEFIMIMFIYLGVLVAAFIVASILLGILLLADIIFKTHIGRKACKWLFNLE